MSGASRPGTRKNEKQLTEVPRGLLEAVRSRPETFGAGVLLYGLRQSLRRHSLMQPLVSRHIDCCIQMFPDKNQFHQSTL